jgi:hypothetical protein
MSLRRRALFLAGLLAAVSCSDAGDPLGPDGRKPPTPEPADVLQALDCTVTVSSRSMTCASAVPGTGAASGLIIGGQGLYVNLASSGMTVAGDTFKFNATVENLLPQALGVEDNGAADEEGVRVFFHSGPNAVGAGGPIVVEDADGEAVFISGNRPYYQYDGALQTDEVSEPRQWKFLLQGATQFNFRVYVSARVKYPQGWVDITPNSALLNVGETAVLADSVFDRVGKGISDDVTWSSSNPAVVTVSETSDSTAQITAVAQGTAWIKAQSNAVPVRSDSILVTVNNAPVLVLDSISAISNVTMPVDSANGMLANDGTDEKLTVSAGTVSTDRGGTATLAANGSFSYLSKPGYAGLDTIRYTVTDGARTLPGKAVVRVENSPFWFVKQGSSGDGRDASPFGTLAAAQDSAVAGDTIIVFANGVQQVDGAVTLEAGQAIIGAGTSQAVSRGTYNGAAITVLAAGGSAPSLTNTGPGATITLGTNNVIRGVGITAAAGAAITGTSFGTLFVRDAGVNPAGPALLLSAGALDAIFDVLSSTGSTTTGLSLTDVTGSLAATGGAIASSVGTAFNVSGGSANITYGGSVNNGSGLAASISGRTGGDLAVSGSVTDAAGGISVNGNSGGTVVFSGALSLTGSGIAVGSNTGGTVSFTHASKSISTGSNPAVSLTSNTGATVVFGGGGLALATTSGAGFTATGGGTVSVTGANNTVSTTTGTAVTLTGVGTGASGVSLRSVSANGAVSGIALSSITGAGLQVTGDGSTGGSGGTIQNTTDHAVSLSSMTGADSVALKFMTVGGGNAGKAGIFGSNFGTLRVAGLSVGTTGGPALSLATGTLNGGFSSLGSASSASNGVILTSTGGSFTADAGTISGAASTAFAVAGGSVAATISGSVSQANAAPVVAVSGGHNGSLTFNTGTVGATNGTGLQFNNAAGTYAFNGTTTLNGGDAAIDITNSSTGSFTFGTGASVTNPTGSAFLVYGSSPTVTYNGSLAKGNAGLLVEIGEQPGGSVTFQTGTLSATAGTGISLSNADGTVAFNGTTTLNGGDAGVDVVSQSSGAISFGTGASIANASGIALRVQNGSASTNVSYAGSVTSSATGLAVHVEGVSGGSVTASGAISGSNGILVQNNTGGTITFSGAKSLNTAANAAVTLATNTGATVDFTNGNNDITTTTGAAFTATGGGTVNVSGGSNDISTGTGNALTLNGVALGASGMSFATVNTGAALAPVSLTNVAVTSGSAITVGGGTIAAAAGTRFAVSGGTVNVNWAGTINQSTHNNSLVSVTNHSTGTLAFSGALSASSGNGLQFDNADGIYNVTGTAALNGGDAAIDVTNGSGGTFSFGGGVAVTNPTNELIRIVSSAPTFTYSGAFSRTSGNATGILAQNNTGGTITFNGDGTTLDGDPADVTKSLSTGTAAAISLVSNSGTTFSFGGGMTLATTSGVCFNATGGATALNVTGAGNTIASGTGIGLNVTDTNIGASGLSFRSVSHSGGANGIVLSNTGSTNGLQVTGDGSTVGSGGSIVNTTGGDGASGGNGVYLSNARSISLAYLNLSGHANNAIYGSGITGLTVNKVRITGTNGTSNSGTFEESPVHLRNSGGTLKLTNSRFDGGAWNGFLLRNSSGAPTVDSLVIANDTVSSMQGSTSDVRNTAVQALIESGTADVRIRNNALTFWWGNAIQVKADLTGSATARITANVLSQTSGALAGAGGIQVSGGNLAFNISGNSVNGANGTAISADRVQGAGYNFNGTIDGNFVGTSGVANSGSSAGTGIFAQHSGPGSTTIKVSNNVVRQINGTQAVWMLLGDDVGGGGSGTMNTTITGNNIAEEGSAASARTGIIVQSGRVTGDTDTMCADVASNSITNFNTRIRPNQRFNTVMRLPGYTGASGDIAAVNTYIQGRNPGTTGLTSATTAGGGGIFNTSPAGSACPQPSL